MPDKVLLEELYHSKGMSVSKIAQALCLSRHKVERAMKTHEIAVRSKVETAYLQHNKSFTIKTDLSTEELTLYGLGIGLYWGEGNKVDVYSVRLGNTDPDLILTFVNFLMTICGVKKSDIRFGLQIFNDMDRTSALNFWMDKLASDRTSFHDTVSVIPPQGQGSYRHKSEHGVLQVYVSNKRLKTWLMNEIARCRSMPR